MWYRVVLLAVVMSLLAVSVPPSEGAAQDRAQFRRELNRVRQVLSQIRRDMTPLSQLITDLSGGLRQALGPVNSAISSIELAIPLDPDNSEDNLERQLLLAQARRSIHRAIAVSQCLAQGSDGSCRALLNLPSARIREIEQQCKLKLDEVGLTSLIQCFTTDITDGLEEAQDSLNAICNQVSDSGLELCDKIFEKIYAISLNQGYTNIRDKLLEEALPDLEASLEAIEDPENLKSAHDALQEAREQAREIYRNLGQAVQLLRGVLQLLIKLKPAPPSL